MIKSFKLLLPVLLIYSAAFGQQFEGKITYQNTYKSKIPNLPDKQFSTMLGTTQEYFIKGGNYKSVTNGTVAQWQIYINAENRIYNKSSNTETISWDDASMNDDSVISVEEKKGATMVLGRKCDELILKCKNGIEKYYFDPTLGVNTELYKNHQYGNWYAYLKYANAVPLKMIIGSKLFSMESVATQVEEMKLEDNVFQLPENAKIIKKSN
jgi:hypothetical protein